MFNGYYTVTSVMFQCSLATNCCCGLKEDFSKEKTLLKLQMKAVQVKPYEQQLPSIVKLTRFVSTNE